VTENTWNYVRHITIDNVRTEGDDVGILVYGVVTPSAVPPSDQWPADASMVVDDVNISNFHFDSGKVPPFASHSEVAIMVGGWGRGGTLNVSDCSLKGCPDDLLEIDSMYRTTITSVYMQDSRSLAPCYVPGDTARMEAARDRWRARAKERRMGVIHGRA